MSKLLVLAAALILSVACNKKEETTAPVETAPTVEQTAPAMDDHQHGAEEAPETTEEMPEN